MNKSKQRKRSVIIIVFSLCAILLFLFGIFFLYVSRPGLELSTIFSEKEDIYRANAGYFYGDIYIKTDEDISEYLYDKHYDEDVKLKASGRVVGYRTASHDCWGVWMYYLAPVIELYEIDM
ncbi:MAG: hypothetical protein IJX15_08850 [Ruminiclostridium sp.]|nr:hypothetical protein [Ruminiclostridium sp.]